MARLIDRPLRQVYLREEVSIKRSLQKYFNENAHLMRGRWRLVATLLQKGFEHPGP